MFKQDKAHAFYGRVSREKHRVYRIEGALKIETNENAGSRNVRNVRVTGQQGQRLTLSEVHAGLKLLQQMTAAPFICVLNA